MIKIVYWSGTGNTYAMAEYIAEGVKEAGKDAVLVPVNEVNVAELLKDQVFALGCPSMGAEQLEESEMEPFMCELDTLISGKKIALFGSYGWGNQEWMRDWESRVTDAGASVINGEGLAVNNTPDDAAAMECKALGRALAGA